MKLDNKIITSLYDSTETLQDSFLEQILENNAITSDLLQSNELLRQLVDDYAALERKYFLLNRELIHKQEKLTEDLEAAGEIQRTLLPMEIPTLDNFQFVWNYSPCEEMGGDLVNIIPRTNEHWVFYIIDVTGHGPKAAMITVAIAQFLNPYYSSNKIDFLSPQKVFAELEKNFPFSRFESLFTIIYGTMNIKTGEIVYCNSAHPLPVLSSSSSIETLQDHDAMLGLEISTDFLETRIFLDGQKKLILFTDGLSELTNPEGEQYGEKRFYDFLRKNQHLPSEKLSIELQRDVAEFSHTAPLKDDLTYLIIESKPEIQRSSS